MAMHGFKLLKVSLRNGAGRTDQDWAPDGQPHYLDRLINDISAAAERRTAAQDVDTPEVTDADTGESIPVFAEDVIGSMATSASGASNRPDTVVRLDDSKRLRSALLITIQYGIVGDHQRAVDPTGRQADTDLSGMATTRTYRALLITPDHGTNGLMAVEVISRSNAAGDLPKRLHRASQDHNLKLKAHGPVADLPAIRALARDGRPRGVELFKTIVTSDSATPTTRKVTMKFPIAVGASEAPAIMTQVRSWIGSAGDDHGVVPADEAKALASILWSSAEDLDFDTARVDLHSESTPSRKLMPLDPREGFVYEIGDRDVDDDTFIREVAAVAQGLFVTNSMEMENDWGQNLDA